MSNDANLSLWQKLKRLLTSRAPHANMDASNSKPESISADPSVMDDATNSTISETKASNNSRAPTTKSSSEPLSLTKESASHQSQTPIIDYLQRYFDHRQWHYTHYKPRRADTQQSHHLSLRMRNRKVDCGYLFRVQEKEQLLAVYGILPFMIPDTHKSAAMLLMTQINYDMIIGNLEMDVADGEIRYKNAIDVEVVGLDEDIVEHLLQSVVAMTTVAYEVFRDLLNTKEPSEDMPTLLGELRAQADARTFFLASKKMQ